MIFSKRERRKILLHIGLPKTASTALQKLLFEQHDVMLRENVLYPQNVHSPDDPKHNFVLKPVLEEDSFNLYKEKGFSRARRIIISNEAISNEFYLQGIEANKRIANSLWHLGELEVCVVIREPQSWLKSYYKQAVINQTVNNKPHYQTSLTLDEFSRIESIEKMLDHAQFLSDISACYQAPVRIFRFEDTSVSSIANYCAGFQLGSVIMPERQNESLPDVAVEVMRQLNAVISSLTEKYAWSFLLQRSLVSEHSVLKTLASRALPEDIAALDITKLDSVRPDISQAIVFDTKLIYILIEKLRISFKEYIDEEINSELQSTND